MSRKSQVTIFIIIGIIIIAAIAGFFLLYSKTGIKTSEPSINEPEQYIEKCARDAAAEAINIMLSQGGYLSPENYKLYEDNKIGYLCYTQKYYTSCVNQEPFFIEHLEEEITEYASPKINQCFQELSRQLQNENYVIETRDSKISTALATNTAIISIKKKFVMTKNGETRSFENFKSALNSPFYNLAIVAVEIANSEALFCNFDFTGYMILHLKFSVSKKSVGEGAYASKIYIIEDRNTKKKLNIAIRSCAVPAGF